MREAFVVFLHERKEYIYFDSELGVSVRLMLPSSFFFDFFVFVFRNPNERIRAIKIHIDQLEMKQKKMPHILTLI